MAGASILIMINNSFISKYGNEIKTIMTGKQHSEHICFIIPEYMNKKIVEKGTKEQKERAWKNVLLTEQLRGRRQVTGLLTSMLSISDKLHRTIYDAEPQKICQANWFGLKVGK